MKETAIAFGAALALVTLTSPLAAAELVVDAHAGTQSGAYASIQKAIDAAKPGDTVTVKAGVYSEALTIAKNSPVQPFTLRAAPGERVIVSGFEAITGWKAEGNGVYSAKTKSAVKDLFVGLVAQQCGRWPEDGTLRPILVADTPSRTFKTTPVKDVPYLAELAKDAKDTVVFYYFAFGNAYGGPKMESYDFTTGDIKFGESQWNRWIKPENNRYSFMNHPALVRKPGSWAFVRDDRTNPKNTAGTVYFKPVDRKDLERTQYRATSRPLVSVGHWKDKVANVVIDGLEVVGSGSDGIKVGGDSVTVQHCLVHHNEGLGIGFRGVKDAKVLSNLVVANGNGVSFASVDTGLIEGNEIASDLVDGLVVAGNISGRKTGTPGANPPTRNVTVRRNYLHHHFLQAHPDNFQMYRDVYDTVIEENFDIWGGQSLMAEEVEDLEFRNNLFMGCEAVMLICGHGNSHRWNFRHNTLWGAGYGFFSFTGHDYLVEHNLLLGGGMPYGEASAKVTSHDNFFSPAYRGGTAKPWRKYESLEKAQTELGQEKGSAVGPVKFANFPAGFQVGSANGNAVDSIKLRKDAPTDAFKAGDKVELNGDGKLRTVKSYQGGVLAFTPALPVAPFRGVMIFNWKQAKSTLIDTKLAAGSPIVKGGKLVYGSTLDPVAFQRGDLLGQGKRTLPVLPPEVAAAIPDPNNVVVPPYGH